MLGMREKAEKRRWRLLVSFGKANLGRELELRRACTGGDDPRGTTHWILCNLPGLHPLSRVFQKGFDVLLRTYMPSQVHNGPGKGTNDQLPLIRMRT